MEMLKVNYLLSETGMKNRKTLTSFNKIMTCQKMKTFSLIIILQQLLIKSNNKNNPLCYSNSNSFNMLESKNFRDIPQGENPAGNGISIESE